MAGFGGRVEDQTTMSTADLGLAGEEFTGAEELVERPSAATALTSSNARRRRFPLSLIVGLVLVGIVVAAAALSRIWTPYELTERSRARLTGPSLEHWAGTDRLGRDLFTQLLGGAESAIVVALSSVLIAGVIGVVVGILAASVGRVADSALLSVIDLMIAFPTLLLAMLIVTARGASLGAAVAAIGISGSAVIARVTRVNAARALREDFVVAAVASGIGWWGIRVRHVLPQIWPTLLVQLTLLAGGAILAESSLSYLGLGTPPPQASWGRMLREAQATMSTAPWGAILPGIAIVIAVLGINLLGDGIRERRDPSLGGA